MVPANDLDKDTMQLQIIADDRISDSRFMPVDTATNKSGNFGAFSQVEGIAQRNSLERPNSQQLKEYEGTNAARNDLS